MTDIAPLGFAIDTGGLEKGKRAADDFAKSVGGVTAVTEKATAATIAAAKAEKDAAEQAARTANAKLTLLRQTEGVTAATIKEAQATKTSADAAAMAARAKYDLAKAGEQVEHSVEGMSGKSAALTGILQGVSREASALAAQMGLGGGAGGRLGVAAAMGAAQGAAGRLNPSMALLGGTTAKLAAGVGGLAVGYIALSSSLADNQDRWASYQQQLVNSLGSQGAAQQSLYEVVDLANQVGISVDSALQSFNRFARAKDSIGATNAELVQMTEIILKIGRSSGVEQGAMQGAMMQLSQALASGRLNGDELRSIMENMQPLAKAIADGLGVSVGQLRRMGAEGELTGDKIFKALIAQGDKANEAFASMPTTVEQAKTRMANQFDELGAHIGDLINASGVLQTGLNALSAPVEGLNDLFRAAAKDGMMEVETNLQKMEARVAKLKQQTAPAAQEFDKAFNKEAVKADDLDKQRREAEQRLNLQREELAAREQIMLAQAMRVNNSREEILKLVNMGKTRLGFAKGAQEKVEDLGVGAYQASEKAVADAQKAVERTVAGLEELARQQEALSRSDPFEKLISDAGDLEEALAKGGATMADTWLQAITISRQTGKSIDEVVAALQRLDAAQQALSDAKEIKALNEELSKTAALTAVIGSGGYADRLAGFNADIAKLRSDRAAMGGSSVTMGTTASAATPEQFIAAIKHIESRGRDYAANGSPLRSSAGALFSMQVMPGTAANPGYGIAPARSQTASEYNRVGEELARALLSKYGDPAIAGAAYHSGPGNLGRLGPAGLDYQRQIRALLGGGSTVVAGAGADPSALISGRTDLFNAQERQRAMGLANQFGNAANNAQDLAAAIPFGPDEVRMLELQQKVWETIQDVAPEYRDMVEAEVRRADAAERSAKAEQTIYDMRQQSANTTRMNAAVATGDPRTIRALELQLRIEEIRRTTPADKRSAMIDEAVYADSQRTSTDMAKATGELRKQERAIAQQYELVGLIGDEARIQNKLLEAKNLLLAFNADITGVEAQNYFNMVEALERQQIALEKVQDKWTGIANNARETSQEIGNSFMDAWKKATREGEGAWKTFISGIEEAFYSALDRMVEQLVISPIINILTNALTSGLGSLFGAPGAGGGTPMFGPSNPGVPIANGAVFNGGGLTSFAGGGLFNVPTRFPMRGGTGLAGEGPGLYEGILPLRRGANGQLGVQATGGGGSNTEVNIYDQRSAGSSEAVEVVERDTGNGMKQIDVMVRDSVKSHFRKGSFDADQRSNYGIPRAVPRR